MTTHSKRDSAALHQRSSLAELSTQLFIAKIDWGYLADKEKDLLKNPENEALIKSFIKIQQLLNIAELKKQAAQQSKLAEVLLQVDKAFHQFESKLKVHYSHPIKAQALKVKQPMQPKDPQFLSQFHAALKTSSPATGKINSPKIVAGSRKPNPKKPSNKL